MKIASVICEYNPFHNGHKYLIDTIKNEHADAVIAIMSGNFVQRGDVAIVDKYKRAEFALKSGCDLVVELPAVFAVSSAENFAKGGVDIAKSLNADMLCFGAENDTIDKLMTIAEIFENDKFCEKLKNNINKGDYYPKAVSNTVQEVLGAEYEEILSKPNNTLAIEYIKALKNSGISPVAIKRVGADHDSDITTKNIASATHIRNLVYSNNEYGDFTDMDISNPAHITNIESAILYKLRTMTKEEFSTLADTDEGLYNRLYDCAMISNSLEELYSNIKTKRYTLARIRRIVICALLGISKDLKNQSAQYVRVLGMNDTGAQLIRNSKLPVIAKVRQDYDRLSDIAKQQFDIDVRASKIYSLAQNHKAEVLNDFASKIIKI